MKSAFAVLVVSCFVGCGRGGNDAHVNVSDDGSVTVDAPGVHIQTGPGGAEVNAPGVRVDAGEGGARVTAPGVDVETGPGGVNVDGKHPEREVGK